MTHTSNDSMNSANILGEYKAQPMKQRNGVQFVKENKQRTAIWLYPETYNKIDVWMKKSNSKSRSEFIEKAVLFYVSSLMTKDDMYLPSTITSVLQGMIDNTESRQSKLLFKLAVEIDIMAHVLASAVEVDPVQLERIRGFCIEEVKRSAGNVSLASSMRKEFEENES